MVTDDSAVSTRSSGRRGINSSGRTYRTQTAASFAKLLHRSRLATPSPSMSSRAPRIRQFLLLVAAACPTVAAALTETYAGVLRPEGPEGTIPIVVELRGTGSRLTGKVDVGFPLNGKGAISSGENRSGQCDVKAILNSSVTLRLQGSCRPSVFEGRFTVTYALRDTKSQGSFRLTRATPDATGRIDSPGASPTSLAACQKANLRCLSACPSGDPDAEFLCTNRCRTKQKACMGKVDKGY